MLIGIFNRGFLEAQDKAFLSWIRERTMPVGFLMLDLDCFKAVNDIFDHRAGDQVLADFAKLVRRRNFCGDVRSNRVDYH